MVYTRGGGSLFNGESTGFLDLLHCGTSIVIINSSGMSPGGGGGGVGLPCVGYTGMCHLTGYAFCISDSETAFKTTLSPWKRVYFTLDLTLEQG